jgi:putative membrane protein
LPPSSRPTLEKSMSRDIRRAAAILTALIIGSAGVGAVSATEVATLRLAQNAVPAPGDTMTDASFAQLAAAGGLAEIEMGRMVMERGSNADVRRFGQQMVEEHTAANAKLSEAAASLAITLPSQPTPADQATAAQLAKLDGSELDRAYIEAQVKAHTRMISLLRWQIASGETPALKSFASQTLPIVTRHLEMAEALKQSLTKAASL